MSDSAELDLAINKARLAIQQLSDMKRYQDGCMDAEFLMDTLADLLFILKDYKRPNKDS